MARPKKRKKKAPQIDAEGGSGDVSSSDPVEAADDDDDPLTPHVQAVLA